MLHTSAPSAGCLSLVLGAQTCTPGCSALVLGATSLNAPILGALRLLQAAMGFRVGIIWGCCQHWV